MSREEIVRSIHRYNIVRSVLFFENKIICVLESMLPARGGGSVAEGVFGGKPNVISVMPPGKQNCPLPDLARGSVVHPAGIEPTTFGVGGRHSIQLRYECMQNGFPFCLYLLPDGVPRGGKKISVVMKQDREALFFFLFLFIVFSFHMFKEL